MARHFADIAFTPSVRAAQARYGSSWARHGEAKEPLPPDRLGRAETAFITGLDGFYQATVAENGWPYVQFRGGPAGFLKVLDDRTLGYADFRGNVQYLSMGNLAANDRVALLMLDHANRRRLKVWARARVVDAGDDPDLIARLTVAGYAAKVERAVILTVEAFDWNCPQHITPRFTGAEIEAGIAAAVEAGVEARLAPLQARIAELEGRAG